MLLFADALSLSSNSDRLGPTLQGRFGREMVDVVVVSAVLRFGIRDVVPGRGSIIEVQQSNLTAVGVGSRFKPSPRCYICSVHPT